MDATEIWHWYAGAPITLSVAAPDGQDLRHLTVGPNLLAGEEPQAIVPVQHWQQAASVADHDLDWSLCGCTVAPGFNFAGFQLAPAGFVPTPGRPI